MACRAVSSQSDTDARDVGPVDSTHGVAALAPLQARIFLHRVVYRSCAHLIPNLKGLALTADQVSAPESNSRLPKSGGDGPSHDPNISKILVQLCAAGTFGQFCRACRRRPNLAVGYAALRQGDAHMACRDDLIGRGVYSQAIFHGPALFFNLMGR